MVRLPVLLSLFILLVATMPFISAEVVINKLYSAWDHTPCYDLRMPSEHYDWRYTILDAMRDLEKDIGHDIKLYAKPVKECVHIVTHGYDKMEGTRMILGEASCNLDAPIRQCHIDLYLESLPLNKAYVTVKHEMFHTMGFGHLTTTAKAEFPAAILTGDLMLPQVSKFNKFTDIDKFAFQHKYGNDGFGGINNYTISYIPIPKNLVNPK